MDVALQRPLAAPRHELRRADPCAFVIFGAGGDLTKRLLLPALYNLAAARLLPEEFCLVGVARQDLSADDFRRDMREALREFATGKTTPETLDRLLSCCRYVRGDFDDPFDL